MTTTSLPRSYRGADAAAPKSVLGGIAAADVPDEAVVFLIGMRIKRLRRLRSWVMPVRAMTRMLVDLAQQEDSPLLHARTWWSGRNVLVVQYWRSAEELGRYATDPDHPTRRPGGSSTGDWPRRPTSASGTRRTPWAPTRSRRSTATCRPSGSRRRTAWCRRPGAAAPPPPHACTARPATRSSAAPSEG